MEPGSLSYAELWPSHSHREPTMLHVQELNLLSPGVLIFSQQRGKSSFIHMDATFLHPQNIIINTHQGLNPLPSGGWALTHLEDHPLMPTWRVVLIFMACLPCSEIPLSLSQTRLFSLSFPPSLFPPTPISCTHTYTRIQLPPCTLSFSLQLQLSLNSGL